MKRSDIEELFNIEANLTPDFSLFAPILRMALSDGMVFFVQKKESAARAMEAKVSFVLRLLRRSCSTFCDGGEKRLSARAVYIL